MSTSLAHQVECITDVQVKEVNNAVMSPQPGPQAEDATIISSEALSPEPRPSLRQKYKIQVSDEKVLTYMRIPIVTRSHYNKRAKASGASHAGHH